MAEFANDAFAGTNGTILSAYSAAWTQHSASGTTAQIASGRVRISAVATALYYHSGTPASADYSVFADIYEHSHPANNLYGVVGRCSTSADTLYMARHNSSSDVWQLYKAVAGTYTLLGSSASDPITTGTSAQVELRMAGTTIELYKRGESTAAVSVTDSAVSAAGKAGIRMYSSVAPSDSTLYHLDNFSAVDTSSAATNHFLLLMGVGL